LQNQNEHIAYIHRINKGESIMTREEKLEKYLDHQYMYENGDPSYIHGIKVGVSWADENPKSPWISVEDKLPEMRSNNNPYSERVYVRYVQTVKGDKKIFYAFDELQYICLSSGKIIGHEWCRHQNQYDRVTHWMPIPQLPKEDGV
jgi:hypothetical protein